ncbi:MAG: pyruvate, phosphate dikinase [Deltaproteobacteria bacterium]|nr:pyruvate, phosphate dikinase [Deltaproteobacteria bacterium]
MTRKKYIYDFTEGDGKNKKLLGGKGANLCEMTQIGLPVPPGFVITTEACLKYFDEGQKLPKGLMEEVRHHLEALEKKTGKGFGSGTNPLLVSVRSGSALSMPGMMDTILNLGLNDETAQALARQTNNERFVYDAYRRFLQLYGKIALGVEDSHFDAVMHLCKKKAGVQLDTELQVEHLKVLAEDFKDVIQRKTGQEFSADVYQQLELAIEAVFGSWMGKRAIDYRREFNITPELANGTAVNIVSMVFGNMGETSATGVGFTRDPGTGENRIYGEYLINAQGEDVVAGIRTPKPIHELRKDMPKVYRELVNLRLTLEDHYREVQDFEFTIENGELYCLQTRNGKMNAWALVRTSMEMQNQGLITEEQALLRIKPEDLEQLLHPQIDPNVKLQALAVGIPASPGAATGKIVLDADRAEVQGREGEKILLVREETKPEDIHGFFAAQGILTSRGGKTSHAAVVARGIGKPCVAGCEALKINLAKRTITIGDTLFREGDTLTIDGSNGTIYPGDVPLVEPEFMSDLLKVLDEADHMSRLKVMANTDTPDGARKARKYGAQGIGLCRTERMFNATDRLPIMQRLIMAENPEDRRTAIEELLPFQKEDFKEIFRAMEGLPVTIRLLDPPIHEFLPRAEEVVQEIDQLKEFSRDLQGIMALPETIKLLDPDLHKYISLIELMNKGIVEIQEKGMIEQLLGQKIKLLGKIRALSEINPMLGHRGIRLGISYPEIYEMQIRAILEAAVEVTAEGLAVLPEIMIPQVCALNELKWAKVLVDEVHRKVAAQYQQAVPYKFGTMIEVVRACMRAGRLAEIADFFSFGTNDLTQSTFSFSREDAENRFLPLYERHKILEHNPFEELDEKSVGRLMEMTIEWGRKTKTDLKIGICGEHGGQPQAIYFCNKIGVNYVSCSPLRIPIARLAAAHAVLADKPVDKAL